MKRKEGSVNDSGIRESKQAVRQRVWELLEREQAAPYGAAGHIPDFVAKDDAAARLAEHPAWQSARVIKAVPDLAQLPVRARALQEGKRVYMAAPRLAAEKPFYLLDPGELRVSPQQAAEHRTAVEIARPVDLTEMPAVDLVVCGSVAVNRDGVRLGKGAGYSDIEVALLQEAGLLPAHTLIATTVHSRQVLYEELPEAEHDFRVDLIVTPDEIIECAPSRRPSGTIADNPPSDLGAAIPGLRAWRASVSSFAKPTTDEDKQTSRGETP